MRETGKADDRSRYQCRVCGLDHYPDMPWGANGKDPSYIICGCCGAEFGYDDEAHEQRRQHWIEKDNCKWSSPKERPLDWDMVSQVRSIAPAFRGVMDEQLIADYLAKNPKQNT
ncbi:hypothetical protein G6N74_09935 [Mesorhizobium sp. CGMCC 1.15528]|uniref:Uncharacterized protein n=1 Tax=Mesorhizobium zhangyense TaxID=1776730 RepID=A0A7C9V8P4_9HYPH|nr:hypothetical protein [Mesorhizobium zhangyense]NGN41386.1 hypothetical protein [Mesorhizobium zhangyense]